jgi:cell division protein FtsX
MSTAVSKGETSGQTSERKPRRPRPAMSAIDLANEAIASLFARPGRTALTILGTVIGVAALVATLGVSRTASNRIVGRFDELAATEILVSSRPAPDGGATNEIPWDAAAMVEGLNGVVAAGTLSAANVGDRLVSTSPVSDPLRRTDFRFAVQAASPGLFDAVRAELRSGRFFDQAMSDRADRVAVVGASAAERLGIADVSRYPALRIGDDVFVVAGILGSVSRQHDMLGAVLIPEGTAQELYRLRSPELVVVETRIGAADLIADQIPYALRPDNLEALKVVSPPDQQRVRDAVEQDLNLLFLTLGAVSLLVGAIGIANVTLVSVMERTGEIGLRRALGASRAHIARQFLIESGAMGFIGGVIGASAGVLVVVAVAAYQNWTPVLDAVVPLAAPIAGGVIGVLAGVYPAMKGATMEPVEALRSGP